ncbi:unnamed protein product [Alopecurus aequalis]
MSDNGDFDCGDACIDAICSGCIMAYCEAVGGKVLIRIVCALLIFAVLVTAVTLVVIAFVARPAGVAVENAVLGRLALADKNNTTGTSLAYNVSITVAVRNRNWLMHAEHAAPLDAELLFAGARFARVALAGEGSMIRPGHSEVYHATEAADNASVALGNAGVADFIRESTAGVFQLELKVVGEIKYPPRHHVHKLRAICPLELALSTATSPATFRKVKCAVFTT